MPLSVYSAAPSTIHLPGTRSAASLDASTLSRDMFLSHSSAITHPESGLPQQDGPGCETHSPTNTFTFLLIKKGKGSFYIVQSPVRWTAQHASHFLPSLTDLFILTPFSASLGSILARQQLRAKTKSLTFPPLSVARYSFIHLSEQGSQRRGQNWPIFETVAKGDSNLGSLDCESGILPLLSIAALNRRNLSRSAFINIKHAHNQHNNCLFGVNRVETVNTYPSVE